MFDLGNILWGNAPIASSYGADSDILLLDDNETLISTPYKVVLFNDNIHTFDEVIHQVCKAIECAAEHAEAIAEEVHTRGKSIVFNGDMPECLRVSSILEEISLHTQVIA